MENSDNNPNVNGFNRAMGICVGGVVTYYLLINNPETVKHIFDSVCGWFSKRIKG